jgi:sugar phosphate isomerase/epimerase
MRLAAELPGGPLPETIDACRRLGITGVGFDIDQSLDLATARSIFNPFLEAGLAIVQLGCYRNLIAVDPALRAQAIEDVASAMDVAGRAGVQTVVCGGGHRDPAATSARRSVHPENWSDRALDIMIESCQEIVRRVSDEAAPLCFEPWVITSLNTPARLERVMRAVDHPKVAVELDVANLVTIERYFDTAGLITECFDRFGDKIRLVHLKDAVLTPEPYIYHIGEAIVGDGIIDYPVLLRLLAERSPSASLMVEHIRSESDAQKALSHMRRIADQVGIVLN